MKPKNILVFGASGQIGRNLIRKLTKKNYKVTAVTRNLHQKGYVLKTQANPGYIDIIESSIFDEKKIRRQSGYFGLYENYLKKLRDLDLVYPCWASRSEIKKVIKSNKVKHSKWPIDPDGQYIYPCLLYTSPSPRDS